MNHPVSLKSWYHVESQLVFLIAVPPNSPRVTSEEGHIDTTGAVAGVYQEDEPMRLKCEVVGGEQ